MEKKIKKRNRRKHNRTPRKSKPSGKRVILSQDKPKGKISFIKESNTQEVAPIKKVRVKVIGIGGGGGNIVAEMSSRLTNYSSKKIDFTAANTDLQDLNSLPKKVKLFSFGQELTKGLGTGRDPLLGEEAAKKEEKRIKKLFSDKRDLFIIVASLGGGTGTGAVPVFAKLANNSNATTLGIFTLPFLFEGRGKMQLAQRCLEKLRENLNAILILPNEKVFNLTKEDTPLPLAFSLLNKYISDSLKGLLRIIYLPGLINIDWADIKTTLSGKGKLAYLNVTETKNKEKLDEFTKSLLGSRVLDYNFEGATNILFNIESSKNISLGELVTISQKINSAAPKAKIIFGLSQVSNLKDTLLATILATGNEIKRKREKKEIFPEKIAPPKKKKVKKSLPIEIEEEKLKNNKPQIRRTALEIKKAEKEESKKEEEKEKIFEIPAFLRRAKTK